MRGVRSRHPAKVVTPGTNAGVHNSGLAHTMSIAGRTARSSTAAFAHSEAVYGGSGVPSHAHHRNGGALRKQVYTVEFLLSVRADGLSA